MISLKEKREGAGFRYKHIEMQLLSILEVKIILSKRINCYFLYNLDEGSTEL